MSPVDRLNALSDDDAAKAFGAVCGSKRWVVMMLRARPFETLTDLHEAGQAAWAALDRVDRLEAFAAHPRIGDRAHDDRGWSRGEQKGMDGAIAGVRQRFVDLNRRYEERFGYIFIVCATGRTAGELLNDLETRLQHAPGEELPIAVAEQAKIIRLRLERLIGGQA